MSNQQYFTITAGRTGSAWLASFLSANLKAHAIEPLEIDDFGVKMPDIRTMRSFNNFGNNDFVRQFWKKNSKLFRQELMRKRTIPSVSAD